jgi:Glycosyltransferase family 87
MESAASPSSPARKSPGLLGIALLLAMLASLSTWFYMDHILREQQIADAAAHGTPRGNLSDLYPRWLGAHELLLHRRNPYSLEITREIQHGYYGRPLDPARSEDPKDQQGFVYPVYVVFLLAPTMSFPFEQVRAGFFWFLMATAAASVFLWLRAIRWNLCFGWTLVLAVLALGWFPMVQGIKLQQLSLLVAGLLAACAACLAGGWLLLAGALLSLSTIKPQLTWPLVLWLLVWAGSDWRQRKRFVFGFATMMILLLAGAWLILPGWLKMFFTAVGEYHHYTQNQSLLLMMFGRMVGSVVEFACVLAAAALAWRSRQAPSNTAEFGRATAVVLALTVVIVPMVAPYNQVLLLPAILVLLKTATSHVSILPVFRLAASIGFLLLVWPWLATMALTAAFPWLSPNLRQHLWPMPFYSNFMLPIFIFALAILDHWSHAASGLREASAAE